MAREGVGEKVISLELPTVKVKVAQSHPSFCNPMNYTVHGILQARILEWVAFPFSRQLNPGLPHCRRILYQLSHKGSPLKVIHILKKQLNVIAIISIKKDTGILEL